MNPRQLLAANVRMLKAHTKLNNIKLAEKCGVSEGTIARAQRASVALDLDSIYAIAKAFELDAWQLLTPNLKIDNPPHICHISPEEEALYVRLREAMKARQ